MKKTLFHTTGMFRVFTILVLHFYAVFFSFETSRFQETYYSFAVFSNDRKIKLQHEIELLSNNDEKTMGSYLNSIDELNKEAVLIASNKKTTGVICAR